MLENKQLVIVIGMHRSGTSLITRSLKSLGIDLGENLLPPVKGHNDKGYWEDKDFNLINIELLNALNADWHSLRLFKHEDFTLSSIVKIRQKARDFIIRKFQTSNFVGLKDPRASILLTFWQEIFCELQLNVKYIIVSRNPISVSNSLQYPHELSEEKSLLLWLIYTVKSLEKYNIENSLVVGYENFMDNPRKQLKRIAHFLSMPFDDDCPEICGFVNDFVDNKLQHNLNDFQNVQSQLPTNMINLYRIMVDLSENKLFLNNIERETIIKKIVVELEKVAFSFEFFEKYEGNLKALKNELLIKADALILSQDHITNIELAFNNQKDVIDTLEVESNNQKNVIATLEVEFRNQKDVIDTLEVESNNQKDVIDTLEVEFKNQKDVIDTLEVEFKNQKDIIATLDIQISLKDKEIEKVRLGILEEQDANIKMKNEVNEIKAGFLWKITMPWRAVRLLVKTIFFGFYNKLTYLDEFKIEQIEKVDGTYTSNSNDPHFVYVEILERYDLVNWVYFEVDVKYLSKRPTPLLYMDFGCGFNEKDKIPLICTGKKLFAIHYCDRKIKQIRWDPDCQPCEFIYNSIKVQKITKITALFIKFEEFKSSKRRLGISSFHCYLAVIKGLFNGTLRSAYNNLDYLSYDLAPIMKDTYQYWINNLEISTKLSNNEVKLDILNFSITPKISVVIPVYNIDEYFLRKCLNSIVNQSYTNWELCIADDNSSDKRVKLVINEYVKKYPNVKVTFRKNNGHICDASNTALKLVTGEFVALMDHDDELAEHALFYVVKSINEHPLVEIIYSDEDKINEKGNRFDPHFKSDFNLDLLYSQNYISHLSVYRTSLIRNADGFRVGFEGSQDYDLLLRCIEKINLETIIHIPHVLYHWRAIEGSTALNANEKSYTTEAGIKALTEHFIEIKKNVVVERGFHVNTYKINWLQAQEPLVSLIIPTYNGYEITKQAINSILEKTTYHNYEIILVDNNSNCEKSLNYFNEISDHEKISVLRYPYPFNYSAINNFAVQHAAGDVIGLINNDVEVINGNWLTEMVSNALRTDIGCVGAMLYYPDNTIQHAGIICGIGGVAGHSHKYFPKDHSGYFSRLKLVQNISAVTAACLLVRKSVFNQVLGLDEKNLTIAFNDVDFCLKVQAAGYRNLWTPYAELYHYESISRGTEDSAEKIKRFQSEINYMKKQWGETLAEDQYYSKNLTKDREDFSIRLS